MHWHFIDFWFFWKFIWNSDFSCRKIFFDPSLVKFTRSPYPMIACYWYQCSDMCGIYLCSRNSFEWCELELPRRNFLSLENFHRSCVEIMHWIRQNGIVTSQNLMQHCEILILNYSSCFIILGLSRLSVSADFSEISRWKDHSITQNPSWTTVRTTLHGNTCIYREDHGVRWCIVIHTGTTGSLVMYIFIIR